LQREQARLALCSWPAPAADNLLNPKLTASAPSQRRVCDISYLPTKRGWLYLTTVLDLFSRKIIGMVHAKDLPSQGPLDALRLAFDLRLPALVLLFHRERGIQYTCKDMQIILKSYGALASNAREGNCWDNAAKERFYGRMKAALGVSVFETREEATAQVFEYLGMYYNRARSYSMLDYRTPEQADPLGLASFASRSCQSTSDELSRCQS
jgi:putative transposase